MSDMSLWITPDAIAYELEHLGGVRRPVAMVRANGKASVGVAGVGFFECAEADLNLSLQDFGRKHLLRIAADLAGCGE